MVFLIGKRRKSCALNMIIPVMRNPGLAEDLSAKPILECYVWMSAVIFLPGAFTVFKCMGGCSKRNDRFTRLNVCIEVSHFFIFQIEETHKHK